MNAADDYSTLARLTADLSEAVLAASKHEGMDIKGSIEMIHSGLTALADSRTIPIHLGLRARWAAEWTSVAIRCFSDPAASPELIAVSEENDRRDGHLHSPMFRMFGVKLLSSFKDDRITADAITMFTTTCMEVGIDNLARNLPAMWTQLRSDHVVSLLSQETKQHILLATERMHRIVGQQFKQLIAGRRTGGC